MGETCHVIDFTSEKATNFSNFHEVECVCNTNTDEKS